MITVEPTYFATNVRSPDARLGPILVWEGGEVRHKAYHAEILRGTTTVRYDLNAESPRPHVWIETDAALELEEDYDGCHPEG